MLPAPNLDDRRFQQLVDEAKRRVQQHCPEWTDHNVSDPGVTLIEQFAYMVDQLLYRINRVPDLHYIKFLDLIGVRLFPPTAAKADVTFWLSAPQEAPVTIPAGTQVSNIRVESEEPIVFTTQSDLVVKPSKLSRLMIAGAGRQPEDVTEGMRGDKGVPVFAKRPSAGDMVLIGLSDAVPSGAVLLRIDCESEGVGIDPRDPPWFWEAWDGSGWAPCEVDTDTTGGFNMPGDVIIHVPPSHAAAVVGGHRAGWLRCRVTAPKQGQKFYRGSPRFKEITAVTTGGTVPAIHAELVRDEQLGLTEGIPGQRLELARSPVVAGDEPFTIELAGDDGWEEWREVPQFAQSGPDDKHIVVDKMTGEVIFGPTVRELDGSIRSYGAVPPKGGVVRVKEYAVGGGRRGNVAAGLLSVQMDPLPFVSSVSNRRAATGGVDGESVRDASARGPILLRTRDRAVTAEDYEQLAREAAPDVARVHCVPVGDGYEGIRLLLVPAVPDAASLRFEELRPKEDLLARVARYLDERRCVGARITVEPPLYQGVTVIAEVQATTSSDPDAVRLRAVEALYSYLNPVVGGPSGQGWPFGRLVQAGELFAVLQRVPGVELVEDVKLFAADPTTGERGSPVQRVDIPQHALVFSYGHQVKVDKAKAES